MGKGLKTLTFNNKRCSVRYKLTGLLMVVPLILSGCGSSKMDPLVQPKEASQVVSQKNTVVVEKGDLTPTFERIITLSGYNEEIYRLEQNQLTKMEEDYDAVFDEVKVEVGDIVSEGDVLLTFTSEALDKKLADSQETKRKAELSIEHYRNLMYINDDLDFSEDIASLENDIYLANVYINDINETYNSLNVVAKGSGKVSFVSETVQDGFIKPGSPLIKVVSDDGYYEMPVTEEEGPNMRHEIGSSATGSDALELKFHVGDRFHARNGLSEYILEVIEKPDSSDNSETEEADETGETDEADESEEKSESDTEAATKTDAKEITDDTIYFKIVDDVLVSEKQLTLYDELPEIKNVCYVDKRVLSEYEGEVFVYKEGEDGIFQSVKVTIGQVIGNNVIILNGLEEGDTVSIP